MPQFKPYNHNQNTKVVIIYQDQLQPGSFEHAVYNLIEHTLDLTVFHAKYHKDATGGWSMMQLFYTFSTL